MFPHQNNIRDRRVSQPPMAPQHLMGMPQQGPGMKIEVYTLLGLLILIQSISVEGKILHIEGTTAQEFAVMFGRNGCIQGVIMPIQPLSQIMTPVYNHNQGICTKPGLYDPTGHQRGTFYHNDYINSTNSLRYYNGHYSAPMNRGGHRSNINSHDGVHTTKKYIKEERSTRNTNNVENRQECAAIPSHYKKEKTPMCLVNELARFNKITHQYRLTNEKGPPHKKSFTVTLALGEEEYTAEGPSIKKAQHAAAAEALAKTSLARPLPKSYRNNINGRGNLTPTVELNALAMKRGQLAVYTLLESEHTQQGFHEFNKRNSGHRGFNRRGRNGYFLKNRLPIKAYSHQTNYTVSLKVGSWNFIGEGTTPQMARHDAASKALKQLRALPVPEEKTCPVDNNNREEPSQESEPVRKSPVSLVFEIALKRNMEVFFEVISEEGPPHLKTFVTRCTIGNLVTVGEGNGKKISKKKAAEKMLVELEKLPSLSPSHSGNVMNVHKRKMTKRKSRNLIKVVKETSLESDSNEETNPVSRLLQIQQATKEKEPVFTVIEEKDKRRGKEFVIEVSFGSHTATGSGSSKKLAKRAAAQNLLAIMGYPTLEDKAKSKSNFNAKENSQEDSKVNYVDGGKPQDNSTGGSYGRQLKPGIYVMSGDQQNSPANEPFNMQMTATIARELLKSGNSPTADALVEQSTVAKSALLTGQESMRPKDQLLSIADLLNFQVHFSDFPKGNHSEFLSLVTMSTDPSHVCHGSGATVEESQDQAALTALRALSEMGLDQTAAAAQELNQSGKVLAAINK